MRTISSFLRDARIANKLSIEDLSRETKIKKSFIFAIENSYWHKLPEYPVVVGFVKNIASALKLSREEAVAILRRDYPPQVLPVNPKPDIPNEFRWSPRLTFMLGVGVIVLLILGYLGFQYTEFVRPPTLLVDSPIEGQFVGENSLIVSGTTDAFSSIVVNTQPALVDKAGNFSTEIEVDENVMQVTVTATSRSGKKTEVNRTIKVELNN